MRYAWVCLRCREEFNVAPSDNGKLLPRCTRCGTTDCTVLEEPSFEVHPIPPTIEVEAQVIDPRRLT